ncbi:ABC transporter ATP-binding protein [Desemzia sp. RIT804]|uniref:ABC transporter ATP-binding protein n=1 Tax=Desemzia sp. RIT 804 TaxID=2810209 RepID=UPI00194F890B|nr:ABC transporter ATP-binding protein [Desemzia sp. RIT 804]MBM6615031.1 ABC transporter ATP-binding protein [Desemzia sp. RIT 804]
MSVIEVNHLTKDYGHGRGIFDVSLQVNKGEVLSFLGPNGAGKTTTIRHLVGFSNPEKGSATINGLSCNKQTSKILENVGYLPGEVALPEGLTGLEFIQMMQGLRNSYNQQRLDYLLDIFQLDPKGKIKRMSLGNKRKLAVVTAFMADPDILILDEPTSGLDPVMQEVFIKFMKEEKRQGKTILLSSHIFSEVDAICDTIAIIKDGKIVSTVKAADIRYNKNKMFHITFESAREVKLFEKESDITVSYSDIEKHVAEVGIHDKEINHLLTILSKYHIKSFREIKFTLESYFMRFYEKKA